MDVEEAAAQLYAASPEQFVAERNALAAEAKAAGDKAGADAIRRLAKPSQPAWQVNLLVREHPGTTDELADVAAALRAAAEGGDPREVRRVNGERQALVSRLADEAGRLAEAAGKPPTATTRREVESTLQAALSSPEAAAQVASGRLTAALFDTGLDALGMLTLAPAPPRASAATPSSGPAAPRGAQAPAEAEGAAAARAALEAAAAALSDAEEAAGAARARAEQGAEEVSQLEARLRATRTRAAATVQEAAEAEGRAAQAREEHARAQAAYDAVRGD